LLRCLERLAGICARLQQWELPARWTHPEDLHLTLRFLGQCDHHEISSMPWCLEQVAGAFERPSLTLPGLGAFGGSHEPRVVYAAVNDPGQVCQDLHELVCDALGVDTERHFHPHITLARPKSQRHATAGGRNWQRMLEAFGEALWGPCPMEELVLYESRPGTGGRSRYRAIASWPLADHGRQTAVS
jgi:2'-5' RNA ligase